MSEPGGTKTRILDAAEKLFGINGFEGTSLRDITAEAGANLAAVNYHFQSKESLIDAVIQRRISPINTQRLELLGALGPNPTVEQILRAFLTPVLMIDLRPVVPLLGRMMSEPKQFVDRVLRPHMAGVSERFQQVLALARPDLPPAERAWRFMFTIGMMSHLLCWSEVLPVVTGGLCNLDDRRALLERAVAFASAGFSNAGVAQGASS